MTDAPTARREAHPSGVVVREGEAPAEPQPPTGTAAHYSPGQRWFALGFGLLVHTLFAVSVIWMAAGIYTGFCVGRGTFHGPVALAANALLLLQFPLLHSLLLSSGGRRRLARMMPLRLGSPLATTTFAGIASLQLILCFAGWSPMHTELWAPPLWLKEFMSFLYALSWLLLIQSMREAGTGLQTGSIGWRSVWQNHAVRYPPPPVSKPLHSIIRHPIYASFALILWTSPVFSLEKILFASAWTAYCLAGSRLKEIRLLRFHPSVYASYIKKVPFWIPSWRKKIDAVRPGHDQAVDAEVVIAGGGPVGLLLANLLGKSGRRVLVLEAGSGVIQRSMAIGITPPSLDILAGLDLDRLFIASGIRINHAEVREQGRPVYTLDFGSADRYPFILALPQSETAGILRANLARFPNVTLLAGQEVQRVEQDHAQVKITARDSEHGVERAWSARFVAACDGAHSRISEMVGLQKSKRAYAPDFIMADFYDHSALGEEAHLFFGPERPVESFPLPGGRRRWIVRSGWRGIPDLHESIASAVSRLTGISIEEHDLIDQSAFRPGRKLVARYYHGRVALCGDAAHVMSPIGGQGMNTGFADAAFLADAFVNILDGRGQAGEWLRLYDRKRRQAFRIAAARAAAGMNLGVARGNLMSKARGQLLGLINDFRGSRRFVTRWFTMRSLPSVQRQCDVALRQITGATSSL